jgi:hypothetical protein
MALMRERCRLHPEREAAARCPSCGRYFCRECVTEHEGRVVCASCLAREVLASGRTEGSGWRTAGRAASALVALLALWLMFLLIGEWLLSIPEEVHSGTLWREAAGRVLPSGEGG